MTGTSRRQGNSGDASARPNPSVSAFDRVADTLYALAPTDFTTARNAAVGQARQAGERDLAARIQALRRPTAAAYALNLLVRDHPELVEQLRELGEDLLQAQTDREAGKLRELGAQRNVLVGTLTRQARGEALAAGNPLGEQAVAEIDQTLRAVLAAPQAADELATGRLTHALTPDSTLPGLTSAPAAQAAQAAPQATTSPAHPPADGPSRARTKATDEQPDHQATREEHQRRLAAAEQTVHLLEAERHAADIDLEHARERAKHAAKQLRVSQERIQLAEQDLAQARNAVTTAQESDATARHAAEAAGRKAALIRQTLTEQRGALQDLRSGGPGNDDPPASES
ncbi:hypothetical protein I2501_04280 [Streptacidiphilus sp. NEAU-YB345]|uniref:Uncharacterized protein n=1 Tax=Streptacidiphilus fuscans TaxID=2789292 RepID=A0A931AXK8_9ACTN|nr:hypothetical protein [Streptacidiphilus fuscans]